MHIQAQISERLLQLLVFADEPGLVIDGGRRRLHCHCHCRLLAAAARVFDLLQCVEDDANVAFEIADNVGHLLRVAQDLDRLVVRVVPDRERALDLEREFPVSKKDQTDDELVQVRHKAASHLIFCLASWNDSDS